MTQNTANTSAAESETIEADQPDLSWICDPCKGSCQQCEQLDFCPMGGVCCPV